MPIVADASVAVRGDISGFKKDLKGAQKETESFGQSLKSALSPKNLLTGVGLGAGFGLASMAQQGFGAIVNYATDAIQSASDLNETISKTGQILGQESLPELERWADGAAAAFGQSKQLALDGASTFAIFGKSAGLAGDDLMGFSTELTELASDLASFHNTSPEDAITAIGAALRGESEPIRRYGVLLNDATLKQRALKLGLIETTTQALTPQQRVLAAQAEIFAQTADAQGDFARTSDGLANTQKALRAEFENLSAEIGEKLLPVAVEFAHWAKNEGIPIIKAFVGAFTAEPGSDEDPIKFLNDLLRASQDAGRWLHQSVTGEMGDISALAKHLDMTYDEVADATYAVMKKMGVDFDTALGMVRDGIRATGDLAKEGLPKVADEIGKIPADAAAALKDGKGDVKDAAEEVWKPIETEVRAARLKAIEEAAATPGDIAQALRDGSSDVDSAMEQLRTDITDEVDNAARLAYLKGLLISPELADGLKDSRPVVRAQAQETQRVILAEIETIESGAQDAAVNAGTNLAEGLRSTKVAAGAAAGEVAQNVQSQLEGVDAYTSGQNVGYAFANGLGSAQTYLEDKAYNLAHYGTRFLRGESPPKEGPLKEIDVWGRNVGEAWSGSFLEGLGLTGLSGSLSGLASALRPSMSMGSLGGAGGVGGGQTINYNLSVNGVQYEVKSAAEALETLQALSAFGDGRAAG